MHEVVGNGSYHSQINGASRHSRSTPNSSKQKVSNSGGSSRNAMTLFGLAFVVALVLLYVTQSGGGDGGGGEVIDVVSPDVIDKVDGSGGDVEPHNPAPNPKVAPTHAATQKPQEQPAIAPDTIDITTASKDGTVPTVNTAKSSKVDMVYSKIATIVPDPLHVPIDVETAAAVAKQWGKWHFWDGDESTRPTDDYCGKYPNRDIPGTDFPDTAWQVDAVFVNHVLNDAEELISRAMEAIFTEYGKGKPLPPEGLAERMKMFHWDKVDFSDPSSDKPPAKYAKKGDRGNGGWTTNRSYDGLVKRLLHACMTNDSFTVVMGGHSAAAGHGNHFHQSYMMQFHKIVAPVLARLGVKLITRNLAQGGLGTLHNAMGAGSLYGSEIDLLLWDSGMTEPGAEHVDLFLRQGMIGGNRVPVLWGGHYDLLKMLHQEADADVGEYGNAQNGIIEVTSEEQAMQVPFASRYMKCDHERQDLCKNEPTFCVHCWIDRDDITNPKELFPNLESRPTGQVKWHPGWRGHQLVGRLLAFSLLDALQMAVQIWSEGTMGGPPLDDEWWHVTDYYENIRTKVKNLDPSHGNCHNIAGQVPARMCNTPMQARSMYTPRNNPQETSITSILKPAPDGYVPRNEEKLVYEGPDVHNPCNDIPAGSVDVLAIVSGRRRLEEEGYASVSAAGATVLLSTHPVNASNSASSFSSIPLVERNLVDGIVPGKGWQVRDEPPGQCDGEYNSVCGRGRNDRCPLERHHDARGVIIGNEYAGWLVMELPNLKEGIIVLKLLTYLPPDLNTRTEGWTTVNNEGRRLKVEPPEPRQLRKVDDLPETFMFDFAIDGKITTLNKGEFVDRLKEPQRVLEVITLLDDPNFTSTVKNVEVAFRMRGCGRACSFALSHVYWA